MKVIDILAVCDIAEEDILVYNRVHNTLDTMYELRREPTVKQFINIMNADVCLIMDGGGCMRIEIEEPVYF